MDPDPFADMLGIEIVEMADGHARARLEMRPELSSTPETMTAHGGVTYALADHAGGAAVISVVGRWPTPTIDMRLDYLQPVTNDLLAEAEVLRAGRDIATVSVELSTVGDGRVAVGRGAYKTGGSNGENAWLE